MASTFTRGTRLYARYKDALGRWVNKASPYEVGQRSAEDLAQQFADECELICAEERRAREGKAPTRAAAELTVAAFARAWLDRRQKRGLASAGDDVGRLENHALPVIGHLLMREVRPRHILQLVEALKDPAEDAPALAPRTVRHVFSTLKTMFNAAVANEVIVATPCVLEAHILPKKVDADPTWRETAIFTRAEVVRLLCDARLLVDRRVLYALKFYAALRHAEAATLTWSMLDDRRPLAGILLSHTKSKVPRAVPVHPELERILSAWRERGWESVYGREPNDDDLVTPTRAGTPRDATEAQRQLLIDLATIGMRRRRGHDLRRSFITHARSDGARGDLLEVVTHGPRGNIIDVYTSFPWKVLCHEMKKLRLPLPARGLPKLAVGHAARSKNASVRWASLASPTGFEHGERLALPSRIEQSRALPSPVVRVRERKSGTLAAKRVSALGVAVRAGDDTRALVLIEELRTIIVTRLREKRGAA